MRRLARWGQFDTFAKDIIIIPVNYKNMHWCCAAVNIREKRFEYYDSLGSPRDFVYEVRSCPPSRAPLSLASSTRDVFIRHTDRHYRVQGKVEE